MNREIKENIPETVEEEQERGLCRAKQWGEGVSGFKKKHNGEMRVKTMDERWK